jgi:hypothetical protein
MDVYVMYCHVTVTIDLSRVGTLIFGHFITTRGYTLQITITKRVVFSVTLFTMFFGSGSNGGRSPSSGFPICLCVSDSQLTVCLQTLSPTRTLLGLTNKDGVNVTLRLAAYRQSVRLGIKPLQTHSQRLFFSSEPLRS